MTKITVNIIGAKASAATDGPLTRGMVGTPVAFSFDSAWDGLAKTAVFRAGNRTVDTVNITDNAVVPWEVLMKTGCTLYIGVYGVSGDGALVIPTVWARAGVIEAGADPSGDESADPTLPVWQQVQQQTQALMEQTRTDAQKMADEAEADAIAYAKPYAVFEASGEEITRKYGGRTYYLNPALMVGGSYPTVKRFRGHTGSGSTRTVYASYLKVGTLEELNKNYSVALPDASESAQALHIMTFIRSPLETNWISNHPSVTAFVMNGKVYVKATADNIVGRECYVYVEYIKQCG